MANVSRAYCIDDLCRMAKRRIPRFVFDFVAAGADSEDSLQRNRDAFQRVRLVPNYLIDVQARNSICELFGRQWGAPVGLAPTGLGGIVWPQGDIARARAAVKLNVPFLLSTVSTDSIEEVTAVAPDHTWFQLYSMSNFSIMEDLLRRARDAGIKVLVVTVDAPVSSKHVRNLHNGFTVPLSLTVRNLLEFIRCPEWSYAQLRAGAPKLANILGYLSKEESALSREWFMAQLTKAGMDWEKLAKIRKLWPGQMVIKGTLSREDVRLAIENQADGVILSNHGGRQFDPAPAPIEMLSHAVDEAAGKIPIMLDSGVMRGIDILRAFALGAKFTFIGKAALYGLGAGGHPGVVRALELLRDEVVVGLGQLGCNQISEVSRDHVVISPWA